MVGMRKDPKVRGGVGGTYEVSKNQTQHSPREVKEGSIPKVPMARRGRGRGTSQNVPNDLLAQMVAALQQVNENLHNLNQNLASSPSSHPLVPPGPIEYRGLDEFCRRNPSQFHGGFAPESAIEWVQGYQSWDSRLSEGFSPGRERLTWEGEILGYTKGFSPERGLARLSESGLV
ncbi:hypothetical protein Lal_00021420 [Lupinus albus]|nr:hypothetical protein Lal_00021420 [Lupinus albus]